MPPDPVQVGDKSVVAACYQDGGIVYSFHSLHELCDK